MSIMILVSISLIYISSEGKSAAVEAFTASASTNHENCRKCDDHVASEIMVHEYYAQTLNITDGRRK